jgi:hypothetical protein
MNITSYVAPIVTIGTVVIGVFFYGWLKIIKETNNLLKEQNTELKIANKELLEKHNENVVQLSSMQGQIDVLKSIPLVNIDATLKSIADFNQTLSKTNAKILERLELSAKILKQDTANAATAVTGVRDDLKQDDKNLTRNVNTQPKSEK